MPILAGFAFGGSGTPRDHTVPISPTSTGSYTLSGTLLQTFTTSGTYTPGVGVTSVDVVVVGGGGIGLATANSNYGGGSGGGVRVYKGVPVSAPVSVTVGGSATASSFGTLSAPAGFSASSDPVWGSGSPNLIESSDLNFRPSTGGPSPWLSNLHRPGKNGVLVNGTYYAGGGGGGSVTTGSTGASVAGGQGGGGKGSNSDGGGSPSLYASGGTNGLGGGGGGGGPGNTTGGSGVVLVFAAT